MILAGDIGGTKSLFGLYEGAQCVAERRLTNADFPGFDEVLAEFLRDHANVAISSACLALAGPVHPGQRCARLTNLPWILDADAVERRHGIARVRLVNDFAAAALGAVTSSSSQLVTIQEGIPREGEPRLVLGAGTGLGVALALPLPVPGGWQIVSGEGGHMGFSPADAGQSALMDFLRQRHGRVTWERVVSGPGLAEIHEFLGAAPATPQDIGQAALRALDAPDAMDSAAARSLELFLAAYGAFAGDLALAALPRGGVYLAGGIAAKVLPVLQRTDGPFLAAFRAKAEHAALMPDMPIRVAIDPGVGLRGAAAMVGE